MSVGFIEKIVRTLELKSMNRMFVLFFTYDSETIVTISNLG